MPEFSIRLLTPADSLEDLTSLLHRSYQRLVDMGFNYTAADQSVEVTRERIDGNECYVAVMDGRIVGTGLLILDRPGKPAWASQEGVAYAGQLGVEPAFRHLGIGSALMDTIEDRARDLGYRAIGGDTSEGADYLIRFYTGRGYEIVDYHQWGRKTYRSVVLAKRLLP